MDNKDFKIENTKVDGEAVEVVPKPLPPEVMERARANAVASDLVATMPDFWKDKFEKCVRANGSSRKGRLAVEALLRRYKSWQVRTANLRARQAKDREQRALERLGEAMGTDRHAGETATVAIEEP